MVAVEEENDEEHDEEDEGHLEPVPLDAVPAQKGLEFFVALVDDESGENDYGKPDFHYYLPHMFVL